MDFPDHTPSEFALIDWIRRRARPTPGSWTKLGIGDDCAILQIDRPSDVLVTTDMLMDGRHFRLDQDGPEAVGYKALAVNLSDIAAMAGIPRAALVAVALPRDGGSRHRPGAARRNAAVGRTVWCRPGRGRYQRLGRPPRHQRDRAGRSDRARRRRAGRGPGRATRSW